MGCLEYAGARLGLATGSFDLVGKGLIHLILRRRQGEKMMNYEVLILNNRCLNPELSTINCFKIHHLIVHPIWRLKLHLTWLRGYQNSNLEVVMIPD